MYRTSLSGFVSARSLCKKFNLSRILIVPAFRSFPRINVSNRGGGIHVNTRILLDKTWTKGAVSLLAMDVVEANTVAANDLATNSDDAFWVGIVGSFAVAVTVGLHLTGMWALSHLLCSRCTYSPAYVFFFLCAITPSNLVVQLFALSWMLFISKEA